MQDVTAGFLLYPSEQRDGLTCNNIRGLLSIERLSDTTTGWALVVISVRRDD